MLITVTETSQKLTEIFSADQLSRVWKSKNIWKYWVNIWIQNLWAQDIYIDFHWAVTVAEWTKIEASGGYIWFNEVEIGSANLISDSANNTNVRVLIN